MFSNIGWGEFFVIFLAGLIVLGPERIPEAVQWTMRTLRQVREYASGATSQLKDELGTDFSEVQEGLAQVNKLRKMNPRSLVTEHLFDGDDSFTSGKLLDLGLGDLDKSTPAAGAAAGAAGAGVASAARPPVAQASPVQASPAQGSPAQASSAKPSLAKRPATTPSAVPLQKATALFDEDAT